MRSKWYVNFEQYSSMPKQNKKQTKENSLVVKVCRPDQYAPSDLGDLGDLVIWWYVSALLDHQQNDTTDDK